jgi:hypothetical protein
MVAHLVCDAMFHIACQTTLRPLLFYENTPLNGGDI